MKFAVRCANALNGRLARPGRRSARRDRKQHIRPPQTARYKGKKKNWRINPPLHYFGSSTRGKPFLALPITTILVLVLVASFSVASIPFHSSSCGLMP